MQTVLTSQSHKPPFYRLFIVRQGTLNAEVIGLSTNPSRNQNLHIAWINEFPESCQGLCSSIKWLPFLTGGSTMI